MRCRDCRCSDAEHVGLWCSVHEQFCIPPEQPLEEDEGEALPPVPRDGQRWLHGRKIVPRFAD